MSGGPVMKRSLWLAILALILLPSVAAVAQPVGGDDVTIHQFFLPGTNTSGWRIHGSRTAMGVIIQDRINAARGYKSLIQFSHNERAAMTVTNVAMPIAGTTGRGTTTNVAGVTRQRMSTAGSIVGIAIASSAVITFGAAHVEATVLNISTGQTGRTELIATIGAGLSSGNTQFATSTRARDRNPFGTGDAVGCNLSVEASMRPNTAEILCTLIIEH